MTPHERRVPHVIDGSRRKRIAAGSGTTVEQVNQLIEGRKQMAKMMKAMGSGKMPALPGRLQARLPGPPSGKPRPSATRKSEKQAKRRKRRGNRMAVKLRLTRVGSKKNPIYRIVAADSRSPRDGKFIEIIGRYNPQHRAVPHRGRRGEGEGGSRTARSRARRSRSC